MTVSPTARSDADRFVEWVCRLHEQAEPAVDRPVRPLHNIILQHDGPNHLMLW